MRSPRTWYGAGDEARTRDIQLGRLKLYQLSYSRPRLIFIVLKAPHSHKSLQPSDTRGDRGVHSLCWKPCSQNRFRNPDISYINPIHANGGGGRIRTSEGFADRFTVCSLWPLGNPTMGVYWSQRRDSNPRPTDYKSVALPAELRWPRLRILLIKHRIQRAESRPHRTR